MGTPGDIEIQIFRRSLNEKFLISPNELHRGDDAWSGLQMDERCMLSALLTMSDGYRTTRKRIDRIAAPQKSSVVDRILKTLRTRRFLRQTRVNGAGGRFTWRWEVFMFPYDADEQPDVSAGGTMPGNPGDGEQPDGAADVPAGQTMGGFSMDGGSTDGETMNGQTMDGPTVDGESGDIRRTTVLEEPGFRGTEEENTPPTPAGTAAVGAAPAGRDGGNLSKDDRKTLNDAVAYAVERRQDDAAWSTRAVAAAAREQVDAGRKPADVARVLRQAADDREGTSYPGRIGYLLTAAAKPATVAAAPSWAEGPIKHLDPATPRCTRHRGQPADNCGGCKADRVAVDRDDDQAPTLAGAEARRIAAERIAAGRRKIHGKDKPAARDALTELAAAAADVTPARPVVDLELPAQREASDLVSAR